MIPLTVQQVEDVIEWMNQWEWLRDTAIPIRFKEDYKPIINNMALEIIGLDVWVVKTDFRPALFRAWVREKVTTESESGKKISYRVEKHAGGSLIEVCAHELFPVSSHCHDALCVLENNAKKVFFL